MTAQKFLQAKIDLLNDQAKYNEYINGRFTEIGLAYIKANCPFEVGQTVNINGRDLLIQHIEPLTWFEFVIIRLYGEYLDTNEKEINGVTLTDQIKLSEPCQDKQEV